MRAQTGRGDYALILCFFCKGDSSNAKWHQYDGGNAGQEERVEKESDEPRPCKCCGRSERSLRYQASLCAFLEDEKPEQHNPARDDEKRCA